MGTFGIGYLVTSVGLTQNQTLLVSLLVSVFGLLVLVAFGWLSDRIGSLRVMYIGIVGGALFAFPYFHALQTGNLSYVLCASISMMALGWSAGAAAHTVLMPALFKAEYRSTGISSSRELQGAMIAGPAPMLATALVATLDGRPWLVACLLIVAQLLSLLGVLIARPFLTAEEKVTTPALRGITSRN